MSVDPELIWKAYSEEFPEMVSNAPKEAVVAEFTRRGYKTEAELPRFIAGIVFDRWYAADFTDGQPVGGYCRSNTKYVNVYETDRAYGGPEEGGWYYTTGEPVASVPLDYDAVPEEIDTCVKALQDRFGKKVMISIEDHFAEYFPKQKPHFE